MTENRSHCLFGAERIALLDCSENIEMRGHVCAQHAWV
jgi:hypothetical protein